MNRRVGVLAVLLVACVVAMIAWFPGHSEVTPSRVLRAPMSASVGSDGGSWYCAGRDVGAGDAVVKHSVLMSAPGDSAANVRLDGFSEENAPGPRRSLWSPVRPWCSMWHPSSARRRSA
ncbi:MAG: hypothetical protein M5U19_22775 [Microthrixaceae bacterium]|nr:hypothetical protein [Microthrixaceae bacterium]